jgi:hypothetical protein
MDRIKNENIKGTGRSTDRQQSDCISLLLFKKRKIGQKWPNMVEIINLIKIPYNVCTCITYREWLYVLEYVPACESISEYNCQIPSWRWHHELTASPEALSPKAVPSVAGYHIVKKLSSLQYCVQNLGDFQFRYPWHHYSYSLSLALNLEKHWSKIKGYYNKSAF